MMDLPLDRLLRAGEFDENPVRGEVWHLETIFEIFPRRKSNSW
jgi:hypothetical protein